MRKFLYALCLLPLSSFGQSPIQKVSKIFEDDQIKPTVLLLGVFHFAGEQVDANTTPNELRIDMLSAERQQQVKRLVDDLAKFKPTKIVFEAQPKYQVKYDSLYQAYLNGKLVANPTFMANETVQIGFRLAKQLGLKTLYPVDAQAFRFQLSPKDSVLTFEKYKNQMDTSYAYWEKRYDEESAYDDTLAYKSTTQQYLRFLNSPEMQARAIGRWLITTKRGSNLEPIGADGFITRYFNRNVRIYSNIQRVVDRKDERILVIYGATHMYFLKTLFAASPEFKLEDVGKYLKP